MSNQEELAEIMRIAAYLSSVGYRDLARDGGRQRLAVARRLASLGVDERILRLLRHYADTCGQSPDRLFCWWLDRPGRILQKIDEMRSKSTWLAKSIASIEISPVVTTDRNNIIPIRKSL